MHRSPVWVLTLVLALSFTGTLSAEEVAPPPAEPTPREAFAEVAALFAQGQTWTADSAPALDALWGRLVDADETDLAADLTLLRLAAATAEGVRQTRSTDLATLGADGDDKAVRDRLDRDRGFWRGVRDTGLATFTVSTASLLFFALISERNEALLTNGIYPDYEQKRKLNDAYKWGMAASSATMFLSLFPLLWGEARQ